MAVIQSTDLDFDQIKQSLKTYLERQEEFADYDFEASGLSNILDVLAYNTHVNGLIANFAINESFLNTAQLRSSVLSHAEALGYYPRSQTGASTTVVLTVNTDLESPPSFVTLPANTTFTAQVDDISYSFQTLESYIGYPDDNGLYTFITSGGSSNITLTEGTLRTKTFLVGDVSDNQVYVIPDETVDTSTIVVKVYDTASSSSFSTYTNQAQVVRIDDDSQVYIIREAPNGYYELIFSNGNVLGQSPVTGNKIVVEYLSTAGAAANGASVFLADSNITIGGSEFSITTTTVSESSGGSEKETVSSIKNNAPRAFATQQRLVTAEDYKALILSSFGQFIDDVSSWGGNDNIPPEYGKVFVSLNFKSGIPADVQTTVKDQIVIQLSDNLAILSIGTEFVDPTDTFLEIQTTFNFDPDLSGSSVKTIENQVQTAVVNYFTTNLSTFGSTFRRSNILATVDDISPAILNSRMAIKAQQRFTPNVTVIQDYSLAFPMAIADPDDVNYRVESSRFTYSGQTCFIRNSLSQSKLQVVALDGTVIVDNIGSYNADRGIITISGFRPDSVTGDIIRVSVTPANESTIRPLRNYILSIDETRSLSQALIDYQNTAVVLTT